MDAWSNWHIIPLRSVHPISKKYEQFLTIKYFVVDSFCFVCKINGNSQIFNYHLGQCGSLEIRIMKTISVQRQALRSGVSVYHYLCEFSF
jgi:hypothetical protein